LAKAILPLSIQLNIRRCGMLSLQRTPSSIWSLWRDIVIVVRLSYYAFWTRQVEMGNPSMPMSFFQVCVNFRLIASTH
jgi:hypothetical protein